MWGPEKVLEAVEREVRSLDVDTIVIAQPIDFELGSPLALKTRMPLVYMHDDGLISDTGPLRASKAVLVISRVEDFEAIEDAIGQVRSFGCTMKCAVMTDKPDSQTVERLGRIGVEVRTVAL